MASRFDGDLLVLTPWRPFGAALDVDPAVDGALAKRVVHTVGRVADLDDLLGAAARTPGSCSSGSPA